MSDSLEWNSNMKPTLVIFKVYVNARLLKQDVDNAHVSLQEGNAERGNLQRTIATHTFCLK